MVRRFTSSGLADRGRQRRSRLQRLLRRSHDRPLIASTQVRSIPMGSWRRPTLPVRSGVDAAVAAESGTADDDELLDRLLDPVDVHTEGQLRDYWRSWWSLGSPEETIGLPPVVLGRAGRDPHRPAPIPWPRKDAVNRSRVFARPSGWRVYTSENSIRKDPRCAPTARSRTDRVGASSPLGASAAGGLRARSD